MIGNVEPTIPMLTIRLLRKPSKLLRTVRVDLTRLVRVHGRIGMLLAILIAVSKLILVPHLITVLLSTKRAYWSAETDVLFFWFTNYCWVMIRNFRRRGCACGVDEETVCCGKQGT